jgi:hypothetical protein
VWFCWTSGQPGAIPAGKKSRILWNCRKSIEIRALQIVGVSMDDSPEPVRDFYRQFNMNYPVVMGNAKTGELYGRVLGLPIAFLISRDGRIYSKHIGATDIAVFEREITILLRTK